MIALPEKTFFRPTEVADYLGVSVKTVYRWIAEGKLKARHIFDGQIRIPREEVEKILS